MKIAILGAGGGGASAVAELTQRGHVVRLWNRSAETLQPFIDAGGVRYEGVLGQGLAVPEVMTGDLARALHGADVALVCLPTPAHEALAQALAACGTATLPVVLNPGHTGGALAFHEVFARHGSVAPPIAEFSTLTYVARKAAPDTVSTTGAAKQVRVACLPGDERAVDVAIELYPSARRDTDVIATGLANVNMVLHPPGAVLGASWVEATGGEFTFYVQGLTPSVGRIMEALDAERLAVAQAYDVRLPDLFSEMQAIGTIESSADADAGLAAAVRGGTANSRIRAPDSLAHRYYVEDFFFGLRPFLAFARIAGVHVPVAGALMALAEAMVDPEGDIEGRTPAAMGVSGMNLEQLIARVREKP